MYKVSKPNKSQPKSKATKAAPKMTTAIRKSRMPAFSKTLDDIQQEYILQNRRGKLILFNSLVALCYDTNVAIVLNRTIFWYENNKAAEKNLRDGRYWTYNSIREIRIEMPYLSERAIRLAIKKLLQTGILIKSKKNYNRFKYDKTSWYSVDEDKVKRIFGISITDILHSK